MNQPEDVLKDQNFIAMNKSDRLNVIIQTLSISRAASVQELSEQLKVSHMTVRRDLDSLVQSGQVRLFHGSVILHPSPSSRAEDSYYSLIAAGAENPEKKAEHRAACRLPHRAGGHVDHRLRLHHGVPCQVPAGGISYTVLSYALNIVSETVRRKNCKSLFSGGMFHENTLMFESPEGLEMIRNFRATKAFISASGVSQPVRRHLHERVRAGNKEGDDPVFDEKDPPGRFFQVRRHQVRLFRRAFRFRRDHHGFRHHRRIRRIIKSLGITLADCLTPARRRAARRRMFDNSQADVIVFATIGRQP